jgi:alkanesulfonate monooxygenase SsuD/methylene tetrahydromethanopterin reductase-like flavin-dependent oxidoreductase (luciferase family)
MARAVMVLSENWTVVPPRDLRGLVEMAVRAERAGVHTVMLSEHVVLGPSAGAAGRMENPRDYAAPGNQDPATPWPDSVVLAAAIAAATSELRVALAAIIAPLRHPLLLAKQLATLDLVAEGRLVVQPTVSWAAEEYAALDVPFTRRGAILDRDARGLCGRALPLRRRLLRAEAAPRGRPGDVVRRPDAASRALPSHRPLRQRLSPLRNAHRCRPRAPGRGDGPGRT